MGDYSAEGNTAPSLIHTHTCAHTRVHAHAGVHARTLSFATCSREQEVPDVGAVMIRTIGHLPFLSRMLCGMFVHSTLNLPEKKRMQAFCVFLSYGKNEVKQLS